MRLPLLLLIVSAAAFAAAGTCEGSISHFVPAVVGNSGGLVNITMSEVPGEGNVYTSVYPRTGITTQESIVQAVSYAAKLSDEEGRCNLIVDFGKSASEIEGPSAGAAMSVMAYALFEGQELRKDTIITGTVDSSGNVGPVGGLYEKAKGASATGAKYFITPLETLYEALILRDFESRYGVRILQARNVEEIIGFMLENEPIEQQGIVAKKREVPALPQYSDRVGGFADVARSMIALESEASLSIAGNDTDALVIKDFFESERKRQEGILGKGYDFSAANEAFLNYIDISTIKVILNGSADLRAKKAEAASCLDATARPDMTEANFEWVIGSDLRQAWARERLQSTDTGEEYLKDESYVIYNELMYAQAWCHVGRELSDAAPAEGRKIDESAWRELALAKINEARSLEALSDESRSRINSAQDSFERGRYGAAIFDSVYVISAEKPLDGKTVQEGAAKSVWGRVYLSHAAFLQGQNQTDAALRTARLAAALDEAVALLEEDMEVIEEERPEQEEAPDFTVYYALAAGTLFLLIIALLLLIRGIYGERKRPLKAYRAKQKKGRAAVPDERAGA